jgi:hypothetical protein
MHRAVPSLLLCVVLAAQEKKSVAGWVVYCDGAWEDRTDAAKPMKIPCRGPGENLWYPISPKSKLVRVSPKLGEWITARNAFSGAVHKYDCGKPGECEPPPALDKIFPEAPSSPLLTFLSDPGKAYAQVRVLLSRSPTGGNQPVIADHAVVRADAIPALADLIRADAPAGKYLIELCPFQPPASCPDKQAPEAISSKPGESAARWPRAVAPGIYEIVRSRDDTTVPMRTADRGLLLVVERDRWKAVQEQTTAGRKLFLGEWKDTEEGRRMFQALLVFLAAK